MKPHAPPLVGLRCPCQERAIRLHVNQPARPRKLRALARKGGGPEAQTYALLGKPQKQRLANDMLRVLPLPGAWALGADNQGRRVGLRYSRDLPAKPLHMGLAAICLHSQAPCGL